MRDFRNFDVWRLAGELADDIYVQAAGIKGPLRYELVSQLLRASDSIGANIAEGAGRGSKRDFARFLTYALGSTNEVEHFLVAAERRGLIPGMDFTRVLDDVDHVRRMLLRFRSRVLHEA